MADAAGPSNSYELDIKDVDYLHDGETTLQARIYQTAWKRSIPGAGLPPRRRLELQ